MAVNDRVSLWGSFGTGFRAPTLNELYRQFRVGTVLTLANYELGPERLVGGEAGVRLTPFSALSLRAHVVRQPRHDPVSNVTLATAGASDAAAAEPRPTRIWGVQTDAEYRRRRRGVLGRLPLQPGDGSGRCGERGARGQVPGAGAGHRGSVEVTYLNPRLLDLTVDIQAVGSQFDDDLNTRAVPGYSDAGLPKYAVVSVLASRRISDTFDVFAGAQNLFDQQYFVRHVADHPRNSADGQRGHPRARRRPVIPWRTERRGFGPIPTAGSALRRRRSASQPSIGCAPLSACTIRKLFVCGSRNPTKKDGVPFAPSCTAV